MHSWKLLALAALAALAACGAPRSAPAPEVVPPLPAVAYPRVFQDLNPDPHVVEVNLEAAYASVELEPGKPVSAWTYNGGVPGPLLQARVGDRVIVHFTNHLDEPTTVHWHGLRISDRMDGVPHIQAPVQPGETFTYDFTPKDAGSFWYHPHYRSFDQIERGLYGPIVIHEAAEAAPAFDVERYFVVDDIRLRSDGTIAGPAAGMDIMHGRYGNNLLVNGETSPKPFAYQRGHVERWRLVNTANARTFTLAVEGASFRIVATDGGLLPTPLDGPARFDLPVGARVDLEVRYTADAAALVTYIPYLDEQNQVQEEKLTLVGGQSAGMAPGDGQRALTYPAVTLPPLAHGGGKTLVFDGQNTEHGVVFTINGKAWPEMEEWMVPANEPTLVTLRNNLGMEHPFHLHGNFFQIVSRNGVPADDEPGLRDTVLVHGGERVVVSTAFENPGEWMYHCHINEHSEHGMMGMVTVEAGGH